MSNEIPDEITIADIYSYIQQGKSLLTQQVEQQIAALQAQLTMDLERIDEKSVDFIGRLLDRAKGEKGKGLQIAGLGLLKDLIEGGTNWEEIEQKYPGLVNKSIRELIELTENTNEFDIATFLLAQRNDQSVPELPLGKASTVLFDYDSSHIAWPPEYQVFLEFLKRAGWILVDDEGLSWVRHTEIAEFIIVKEGGNVKASRSTRLSSVISDLELIGVQGNQITVKGKKLSGWLGKSNFYRLDQVLSILQSFKFNKLTIPHIVTEDGDESIPTKNGPFNYEIKNPEFRLNDDQAIALEAYLVSHKIPVKFNKLTYINLSAVKDTIDDSIVGNEKFNLEELIEACSRILSIKLEIKNAEELGQESQSKDNFIELDSALTLVEVIGKIFPLNSEIFKFENKSANWTLSKLVEKLDDPRIDGTTRSWLSGWLQQHVKHPENNGFLHWSDLLKLLEECNEKRLVNAHVGQTVRRLLNSGDQGVFQDIGNPTNPIKLQLNVVFDLIIRISQNPSLTLLEPKK